MPRRDAQVHKTLSRLIRGSHVPVPVWYEPLLAHPPTLPGPLKLQHERRKAYDLPPRLPPSRLLSKKPVDIVYPEDRLRKQFFEDHPFEAFRARTLVEAGQVQEENPISGAMWERLAQRGRNPSPEDCIQFAVNLHQTHSLPLSDAYRSAVHQYRALRAEHSIMLTFAANEAESYGAKLKAGELDRVRERDIAELAKWRKLNAAALARLRRSKKWSSVPRVPPQEWTGGEGYMRKLREEGGGPLLRRDIDWPEEMMTEEMKARKREREMLIQEGPQGDGLGVYLGTEEDNWSVDAGRRREETEREAEPQAEAELVKDPPF